MGFSRLKFQSSENVELMFNCQSSLMFSAIFLRFVSVDKLNDFSALEVDLSRLEAWADYYPALFMLRSVSLMLRRPAKIINLQSIGKP